MMLTLALGDGGAVRVTAGRVTDGPAPSCAAAGDTNAKPQSPATNGVSLRPVGLSGTMTQLPPHNAQQSILTDLVVPASRATGRHQLGLRAEKRTLIGIGISFGGGSRSVRPPSTSSRTAASSSGVPADDSNCTRVIRPEASDHSLTC